MPFWAVVRQARSGIEHVVPLAAATEHKAFYEEEPAVDWWPINDVQPRIQALRAHGSAAPSLYGFEQRRGTHHTACMLHDFRDTPELRAAVWIGSCLWDLHKERGSPGQSTLRTRLGHDLLDAVVARLREAGGAEWHHATSSVLPATPFVRPLTEMVTPKEHEDYAYLAALQFAWVRSMYQLARVFHSDNELSSIGEPTSA